MDLVLKVQWQWGGAKVVRTCADRPVCDVLSLHGFSALENATLLVAHKGRVIDGLFTFGHHDVRTGDRLVCLLRRPRGRDRSSRFRDMVWPVKRVVCQLGPIGDPAEASRRAEIARMTDLSFIGWELMPDGQRVMEDFQQEKEKQPKDRAGFSGPTVVTESQGMSEAPLPIFSQPDAVLWSAISKGKRWPPGFVNELSDQARGEGPFDGIEKP
jgi:hypothetical protein